MTQPPFFFTSYAERRADSDLVERFHARLELEAQIKRGRSAPHEGFLNTGSLALGQGWRRKIGTALGRTRFLVVLLTDDYLVSPWCAREWAVVRDRAADSPEDPVALLPLFWTRPTRELPTEIADLQLRMRSLGPTYTDTCLVDLMREDPRGYERFVIGLMDHMVKSAGVELPEMAPELAEYYPPAFGLGAPEGERAPEEGEHSPEAQEVREPEKERAPEQKPASAASPAPSPAVAHSPRPAPLAAPPQQPPTFTPTDKRTLVDAYVTSPISTTRETYELWLESVRIAIAPLRLAPSTDAGTLRNRVLALVNFAQQQKTPAVLLAFLEALEEQGDDEATAEVRRLTEKAAGNWPRN